MKEKNRHIITEAINNLPQYEPKPSLWDAIDMELTIDEKEKVLRTSVQDLPNYDPPAQIWESIENQLDQDLKPVARVFSIKRWASVAAVFAMVSVGLWTFFNQSSKVETIEIAYSEEKVTPSLLEVNWEEDEDAFEMVAAFCKNDNLVCKIPEFKVLTDELDELNAARNELKDAMEVYGNDPELIAQLTSIEHERSDVLKQIIKKI